MEQNESSSDEEIIIIRKKKVLNKNKTSNESKNDDKQNEIIALSSDDEIETDIPNDENNSGNSSTSSDIILENGFNSGSNSNENKQFGSISSSSSSSSFNDDISVVNKLIKKISIIDDYDEDSGIKSNHGGDDKNENLSTLSKDDDSWYSAIDDSKRIVLESSNKFDSIVEIDPGLCSILKPHQIDGIRFLYNSIINSLESLSDDSCDIENAKKSENGGCILAHSMGLGKTLQVITFIHTLFTHSIIKKHIKHCMIIVPLNVAQNWYDEFLLWFKRCQNYKKIPIFKMFEAKTINQRRDSLRNWRRSGGIILITSRMATKMIDNNDYESTFKYLTREPDLVIIDEGHLLKNNATQFYKAVLKIKTLRRIILTGTPLQNNLSEYYYMVDFVKPKLLGRKERFYDRFEIPITAGQMIDSSDYEIKLMNKRLHVLQRMVKNYVHRCDYNVLVPYLPPKLEFVVGLRMSSMQSKLYRHYIDSFTTAEKKYLFRDSLMLMLICNHPAVLLDNYRKKYEGTNEVIDYQQWWWKSILNDEQIATLEQLEFSTKFQLMFEILEQCEKIGDKLLVFSQSLSTLDLIEKFLNEKHFHKGQDYYRIDGQVDIDTRHDVIERFNNPADRRSRLMLISTRAGGLGINLIGANRCILMDCSWNPANDCQAIFRIFRLGQKKPVCVYRLISYGTMEWKIYQRQVQKQSLAKRVVDEQHIIRHYTHTQLAELYKYDENVLTIDDNDDQNQSENNDLDDSVIPELPKDNILADLILLYGKKKIFTYHEHDSLMQQRPEEELDENEKREAWMEYIREKNKTDEINKKPIINLDNSNELNFLDHINDSSQEFKPPAPQPLLEVVNNDHNYYINLSSSSEVE